MKKLLKMFAICGLSLCLLTGCSSSNKSNTSKNNSSKSNTTETTDSSSTSLKTWKSKYTKEANEIISGFADGDAAKFIYSNLGKDMSSYTLKDLNGNDVNLADGTKTVLEFIRYDCSACIASGTSIKSAEEKFDGNGYRFIQIFINGDKNNVEDYYKSAGISHFNTIVPFSEDVDNLLSDIGLEYVPSFLFVDESKKVSLGMVGYTFADSDFEELVNDYAYSETKLYDMTKNTSK